MSYCWTNETVVPFEWEIPTELPYNDYFEYFGPDFKLEHIEQHEQRMSEYMNKIRWEHKR